MKKTIIILLSLLALAACKKDDSIGGTINSTEPYDGTTFEWLSSHEETAVVADLFAKAGLTDAVNGDVTIFGPTVWAVNRYVRRHNSVNYRPKEDPRYSLDEMTPEELAKMAMYIYPGKWWRETIPEDGVYLTSIDGKQEIFVTLDETNTDPGSAYDGGNVAGYGFQYSNFMMSKPKMIHVLFKRGENWEHDPLARLNLGLDTPECDQSYRMYISDVRTKTGVINLVYIGDYNFSEHYYYHTLFFFGNRNDDK